MSTELTIIMVYTYSLFIGTLWAITRDRWAGRSRR